MLIVARAAPVAGDTLSLASLQHITAQMIALDN